MACTFCWSRVLTYLCRHIRFLLCSSKFINKTDAKQHHSWNTMVICLWPIYVASVVCGLFPWFSIAKMAYSSTRKTLEITFIRRWWRIFLTASSNDIIIFLWKYVIHSYKHIRLYDHIERTCVAGTWWIISKTKAKKNFPCLIFAIWNDDIRHWDSICRAAMTKDDEWWKPKQEAKENNNNNEKVEMNGIMFTGQAYDKIFFPIFFPLSLDFFFIYLLCVSFFCLIRCKDVCVCVDVDGLVDISLDTVNEVWE